MQALAQLNGTVMDPAGEVDLGFRRLIGDVVAMFAHLDGWIDTMATPLEAPAAAIAQRAPGDQGWTAVKHAPRIAVRTPAMPISCRGCPASASPAR